MKAIAHKEEDRTKSVVISIVLHAILLALLFLWHVTVTEPILETQPIVIEWGGGGSNAAEGLPDAGQGNEAAATGQQLEDPTITEPVSEPTPTPPTPAATAPSKPADSGKKVATSNDADAAAIRKAQQEAKDKAKADADAKAKAAAAERQRIADEAAAKKRQQEEYDKKKGTFGGQFGSGTGPGTGNNNKPGTQGVPGGTGNDPFGKTAGDGGGSGGGSGTGTGVSIGGGLAGRKLVSRPRMADNSQKTGKIMVMVCVDSGGNVISADYTLSGSTTNDGELRNKAIQWAKQHKFGISNVEKECGTFAFNFQLQ
ncbi:MAG: hypothetical protein IPL65_11915 [Lewinellaceae bacterium]|nr:hypothetical protein [Lewinellaceae bacterium]